ncbi:hypothetical protein ALC53_05257, partial [Atta colombica]
TYNIVGVTIGAWDRSQEALADISFRVLKKLGRIRGGFTSIRFSTRSIILLCWTTCALPTAMNERKLVSCSLRCHCRSLCSTTGVR